MTIQGAMRGAMRWRKTLMNRKKAERYDAMIDLLRAAGRVKSDVACNESAARSRASTLTSTSEELLGMPGIVFSPSSVRRRESSSAGFNEDSGVDEESPHECEGTRIGGPDGQRMLETLYRLRTGLAALSPTQTVSAGAAVALVDTLSTIVSQLLDEAKASNARERALLNRLGGAVPSSSVQRLEAQLAAEIAAHARLADRVQVQNKLLGAADVNTAAMQREVSLREEAMREASAAYERRIEHLRLELVQRGHEAGSKNLSKVGGVVSSSPVSCASHSGFSFMSGGGYTLAQSPGKFRGPAHSLSSTPSHSPQQHPAPGEKPPHPTFIGEKFLPAFESSLRGGLQAQAPSPNKGRPSHSAAAQSAHPPQPPRIGEKFFARDAKFRAIDVLRALDKDGDGLVSRSEINALYSNGGMDAQSHAELERAFHAADKDGNGVLDVRELKALLNTLGAHQTTPPPSSPQQQPRKARGVLHSSAVATAGDPDGATFAGAGAAAAIPAVGGANGAAAAAACGPEATGGHAKSSSTAMFSHLQALQEDLRRVALEKREASRAAERRGGGQGGPKADACAATPPATPSRLAFVDVHSEQTSPFVLSPTSASHHPQQEDTLARAALLAWEERDGPGEAKEVVPGKGEETPNESTTGPATEAQGQAMPPKWVAQGSIAYVSQ